MAAGDLLLDADGDLILDDDGDVVPSDGAGDGCCCGGYVQSLNCITREPVNIWWARTGDTIDTDFGDKTLPFFFSYGSECFYVPRDAPSAAEPGTMLGTGTYEERDTCCCVAEFVWVFKWSARFNCATETFDAVTQLERVCVPHGSFRTGWRKVGADEDGCDYEFWEGGPCCEDEEDPPDWPAARDPTGINFLFGCSCDEPCTAYGTVACTTDRIWYPCEILVTVTMFAAGTCPGKSYTGFLPGGPCESYGFSWATSPVSGGAPGVVVQFFCADCPAPGTLKVLVQVEYDPGSDCDGSTGDPACADIIVPVGGDLHTPKTLDLYRGGVVVGSVTYVAAC